MRERPEYQTGITHELKLQRWLMQRGNLVARVRHGTDLAPLLRGWDRAYPLPDLQVFMARHRRMVWVDCKAKTTAPLYRNFDFRTTGIDYSDYCEYQEVERETGFPVWVVFCHRDENEVRCADLQPQRGWFRGSGSGDRMMFVRYDGLPLLCTYHELMACPAMPATIDAPLFAPRPDGHWIQGRLDLRAPA